MAKTRALVKEREPRSPAPDVDYVEALYQLRRDDPVEADIRRYIRKMRTQFMMRNKLPVPRQYKAIAQEVRTPFTRDTALRVTAALTKQEPVAHVEPRSDDRRARDSANIAERWSEAAVESMNDDLGEDARYESAKDLVRDSEAVLKVVHRPDAWASFPERERGESPAGYAERSDGFKRSAKLPFAWKTVDRLQMVFGEGEYGDDWAIEYGEYPKKYLGRRYEMVEDDKGRLRRPDLLLGGKPAPEDMQTSNSGRAVKVELWEADWWHVIVDGQAAPGFPKPNPYAPHLPYFRARTPDPVLYALQWLVPALDAAITMKMTWGYLGAYPSPRIRPVPNTQQIPDDPEGDDGQGPAFEWKPGMLIRVPSGYEIDFLSPPPVGQDLDELIGLLRSLVDVAGIPSVFRGVGGADQPGYAINQLIAAAALTHAILAKTLQRQFEQALSFTWFLIDQRIRQAVYVGTPTTRDGDDGLRWLGLSPDKEDASKAGVGWTQHLAKLTYVFKPMLPTDAQSNTMIAIQATNAPTPLYSRRTALEKVVQHEDPDREEDLIWLQRKLDDPMLDQIVTQRALEQARLLPPAPNPAAQLVGPDGTPLLPPTGMNGPMPMPTPYLPGQAAAGMPAVPGLTQPLQPQPPNVPGILPGTGGRPAGSFPGRPGGVQRR